MIAMAEDASRARLSRRRPWLLPAAKRLVRSERGVTMIEFALVFPIMVIMFIGLVEFGEGFSIDRKIENAASTISDLVSQESSVNNAELGDIATVATELLKPYRTAPLTLRITSVVADAQNRTTVAWTYPAAGGPLAGAAFVLPRTALTEANSSIIVAQTSYAFAPALGYFIGSITLRGNAYFRPRASRTVAKTD
jgi:Flp pilus assembly protein TadG